MTPPQIRPATPNDTAQIERLSDLVQSVHATSRPDIFRLPVDDAGRAEFLQDVLAQDNWTLDVATVNDRVIAYMITEMMSKQGPIRNPHKEGHIHQLCVNPRYHRHGVGTQLVHHALARFKQEEMDRITVAYWNFNTASRSFFTAAGFEPVLTTAELKTP